jgi:hypothetical protein
MQRQGRKERNVDSVHHLPPLCPARNVGLIRDTDEKKPGSL